MSIDSRGRILFLSLDRERKRACHKCVAKTLCTVLYSTPVVRFEWQRVAIALWLARWAKYTNESRIEILKKKKIMRHIYYCIFDWNSNACLVLTQSLPHPETTASAPSSAFSSLFGNGTNPIVFDTVNGLVTWNCEKYSCWSIMKLLYCSHPKNCSRESRQCRCAMSPF